MGLFVVIIVIIVHFRRTIELRYTELVHIFEFGIVEKISKRILRYGAVGTGTFVLLNDRNTTLEHLETL